MADMIDEAAARAMGVDPARLRALADDLDAQYVATGRLAHLQLLVSRDETVLLSTSRGRARESGDPLRDDALFRIASMTKPLTSVAFMMLVEEGMVSLDTLVSDVIPEFADVRVGVGNRRRPSRPMRMIDLLTHMSGLTYGLQRVTPIDARYRRLGLDEFQQKRTSDAFIADLAALPLENSPGERWTYSVSTDVLGVVVERLTGNDLQQVLRNRICDPLGMPDTWFELPDAGVDRMTDAWRLHDDGSLALADLGARSGWRRKGRFLSGGGGLISSTADYHRFCRMLLRGGELNGVRLLRPETIASMRANHLPGNADLATLSTGMFAEAYYEGTGFGLGFATDFRTREYYWGGVFSTFFVIDPVDRVIGIMMTQLIPSNSYPIRAQFRTGIREAIVRRS